MVWAIWPTDAKLSNTEDLKDVSVNVVFGLSSKKNYRNLAECRKLGGFRQKLQDLQVFDLRSYTY